MNHTSSITILSLQSEKNYDDIRAIVGSICLVFGIISFWICVYKCALCLEKKEKRIHPISQNSNILV